MKKQIAAFVLASTVAVQAGSRSTAAYSIPADSVDGGGRRTTAAAYSNDGVIGSLGGVGAAAGETAKHGYVAQLLEASGIAVTANPTNVNEHASRQLAAQVSYDDATVSALNPAAVAWSAVSGPLVGVNSLGVATAQNVYQDTLAVVSGAFGGASNTLGLLVLNTGNDDFQLYAADGLDDAWQVQYFGIDNLAAQPGNDADGDDQSNAFEYMATTVPTNGASRFRMTIETVPARPLFRYVRFNPYSASRNYSLVARPAVETGAWSPLGAAVFSTSPEGGLFEDQAAADPTRFYKVQISLP